ncbi:unnamed protein product [Prorocentrum cordatum]|uniref:RRM domain-containing protein n=1 Tax=Prorocentrum cordatum TaxID=2364126 RepID=A0ABN9PVH0_9DINO|nr:unnamed protein product [Polarella glacialis]
MSRKPEGHTLPRTRLSAEKLTGLVTQWKGKYGWIKPGGVIEHEKAKLKNGNLFCTMNDIMDGSGVLHPGAPCEFHLYEDETGLGAEEVVETGPADPSTIPPEDQGKSKGKGGFNSYGKAPFSNGWGGDKGFGKAPAKGFSKGWSEPYGFGDKGGGKGWGGSWGGKGWGGKGWGGSGGGRKNIKKENAKSTVWLGGVPAGVSKEEIKANFEAAGSVKLVELIKQGKEGFVIFSSPEEAMSAIAMFNGAVINGSAIQVDTWNVRETTA